MSFKRKQNMDDGQANDGRRTKIDRNSSHKAIGSGVLKHKHGGCMQHI